MLAVLFKLRHLNRFEVLMAGSTKMAVFWVVVPCNLVKVYSVRGPCHLHHQGNDKAAARTPETLVNFYQNAWHYNTENGNFLSYVNSKVFRKMVIIASFEI
jgi:hypothetical protein